MPTHAERAALSTSAKTRTCNTRSRGPTHATSPRTATRSHANARLTSRCGMARAKTIQSARHAAGSRVALATSTDRKPSLRLWTVPCTLPLGGWSPPDPPQIRGVCALNACPAPRKIGASPAMRGARRLAALPLVGGCLRLWAGGPGSALRASVPHRPGLGVPLSVRFAHSVRPARAFFPGSSSLMLCGARGLSARLSSFAGLLVSSRCSLPAQLGPGVCVPRV